MEMKKIVKRSLLALSLAFLGSTSAAAQTTATDDVYLNNTYTWTSAEGVPVTSNFLEEATTLEQMKALVANVYSNKNIPGNHKSGSKNISYELKSTSSFFGTKYNVAEGDYKPNVDAATVLLVQMKDSYNGAAIDDKGDWWWGTTKKDVFDDAWAQVKSIRVIPGSRQKRVDNNGDNNGLLVNIHEPLNKFYVMLKGNVYTSGDGAPFYYQYEEIAAQASSGNKTYVENAYNTMLGGDAFKVAHNCYSVLVRGHATMMQTSTSIDSKDPNMLLFIPDNRGTGNNYSSSYNPYYFFFTINLEQKPELGSSHLVKEGNKEVYTVPLQWTSPQKKFTKDNLTEEYIVYRSYDGVTWTPVPAEDIIIDSQNTTQNGDKVDHAGTGYTQSVGLVTNIKVREDKPADSRKVYYKVDGRTAGTSFDYVNSNVVEVILPGNDYSEPLLRIDLVHKSNFSRPDMKNYYENTVGSIQKTLIPVTNQNIADNTVWTVKRATNKADDAYFDIEDQAPTVATITFKRGTATDTEQPVDVTISYADGRTDKVVWKSGTATDAEFYLDGNKNNKYLFTITDKFAVSVADKADDSKYEYRLFAKDFSNTDPKYTSFSSNRESVTMPGNWTGTGYITYTLQEIQSDLDHTLDGSSVAPRVTIAVDDSKIERVDVISAANANVNTQNPEGDKQLVVRGLHGQSNEYSFLQFDKNGQSTALGEKYRTPGNFANSIDLPANKVWENESVLLVTWCKPTGTDTPNNYGSPISTLAAMPTLHFKDVDMQLAENLQGCSVQGSVYVDFNGQEDQLGHHGYGFWRDDTQVKKPQNMDYQYWLDNVIGVEERSQLKFENLRHHHGAKGDDAASDKQFHFMLNSQAQQTFAQRAVTEDGQGGFSDNVSLDHLVSKDEPATVWMHARWYANVLDAKGEPTDRYILVPAADGWRKESVQGGTTGVNDLENNGVTVKGVSGGIQVDGTDEIVMVFNLAGEAIYEGPAGFIEAVHGLYIVAVGETHVKVEVL